MTRPEDFTILVVDDEPDVVLYLKTLLEDAGFNVMTAADGNEAEETGFYIPRPGDAPQVRNPFLL
jgi:CheY-like chemotaxis protein